MQQQQRMMYSVIHSTMHRVSAENAEAISTPFQDCRQSQEAELYAAVQCVVDVDSPHFEPFVPVLSSFTFACYRCLCNTISSTCS
jgi:hypothetical protein